MVCSNPLPSKRVLFFFYFLPNFKDLQRPCAKLCNIQTLHNFLFRSNLPLDAFKTHKALRGHLVFLCLKIANFVYKIFKKWAFFHSILGILFLILRRSLKRLAWPLQAKKPLKICLNFRGLLPHCVRRNQDCL